MRFPEFKIPKIEYYQDCQNDNFFDGIFLVRTFLKPPKLTLNHFWGGQEVSKNAKLVILNITEIVARKLKS